MRPTAAHERQLPRVAQIHYMLTRAAQQPGSLPRPDQIAYVHKFMVQLKHQKQKSAIPRQDATWLGLRQPADLVGALDPARHGVPCRVAVAGQLAACLSSDMERAPRQRLPANSCERPARSLEPATKRADIP